MTIEEKRKALEKFCNHRIGCDGCILYSQNCAFGLLDDAEVEKSYSLAYKNEGVEALKAEIEKLKVLLKNADPSMYALVYGDGQ